MSKEIIKTPTTFGQGSGPKPSGKVEVNGAHATVKLPERTTGPNTVPEVTYDINVGPKGTE